MMQDESAEIPVQLSTKKADIPLFSSYSEEGPDDEFRPVKISIITQEETRDEGDAIELGNESNEDIRMDGGDDRDGDFRDEIEMQDTVETTTNDISFQSTDEESDTQSVVSALGESKSHDTVMLALEPEGDKSSDPETYQKLMAPAQTDNGTIALFDASLLDEANEDGDAHDCDDLSVVSKSVVTESSKNVEEAEALAKKMQEQLAEQLAEFSDSPKPSIDDTNPVNIEELAKEDELPESSESAEYYSTNKVLKLAKSASSEAHADHIVELPHVGSNQESSASVSTSSTAESGSKRRLRSKFRNRRPTTASWTNSSSTEERVDDSKINTTTISKVVTAPFKTLNNLNPKQQQILESVVIPAAFLVVSVAICRTFFHPWLKVGNSHSSIWALTWMILCIVAVMAPVCALEYLLLGGLLAGTAVQETLARYPEVKKFFKDFRRLRLKAGWWYPSEVRTLRRDVEERNAHMLLQHQGSMVENYDDDDSDARSIRRQVSREEHRREKAQLENVFESERTEWFSVKEQLMAEALTATDKSTHLQSELETEQQKQKQLVAQKEQLENNIEVERAQWKFTKGSLEEALKIAIAAQEDNEQTRKFFDKMEEARSEERTQWDKERQGFVATIQQAEEDARTMDREHEAKLKLFDEMRVSKQAQWDAERATLKQAVKTAIDEAKAVKDDLESRVCKLMDANDTKTELEIRDIKAKFLEQQVALQELLEEAKGDQEISLQCVDNLQRVMQEERTDWSEQKQKFEQELEVAKTASQKLEHNEEVFAEERATWQQARTTFEDALEAALAAADKKKNKSESSHKSIAPLAEDYAKSLREELKSKESKIKALEESIKQLENIVLIQETIDRTAARENRKKKEKKKKANLEANNLTPVAYVPILSSRSIELSSSASDVEGAANDSGSVASATMSESSSYYSWVQRVQDTHSREQRQMLKGLLTQHFRWQTANRHISELLETSCKVIEASSSECPSEYATASVSAKQYMDELISRTSGSPIELPKSLVDAAVTAAAIKLEEAPFSDDRSVAKVSNPWLKSAQMWEQVKAKTSPQSIAKTICSGIVVGTGVGMGLFQLNGTMKKQNLFR